MLRIAQVAAHRCRQDLGLAAVVDVETTGLSPLRHEIVELAMVLFAYQCSSLAIVGVVDTYSGLREPRQPIGRQAARIHGLTQDALRGRSLDRTRIAEMIDRAGFFVAHNAQFDRDFVGRLFPTCTRKAWLCSLNDLNWKGIESGSRTLEGLLQSQGVITRTIHRAESDAHALLWLLSRQDREGHSYFSQMVRRSKRVMSMVERSRR